VIDKLEPVLKKVHAGALTPEEATAIIEIAQIVVDIDGREGPDEIKLFWAIGKSLFEMAGQKNAEIPTFASGDEDEDRMFELATELKGSVRELTYVVARALAGADLDVAPAEDTFLDRLRGVLTIAPARATELANMLR
jgi:hypothetical protein